MSEEFENTAFFEEAAKSFKGKWRALNGLSENHPVDLEIGTGNGYFFEHRSYENPGRLLIGIEAKFKPLVQTIRRATRNGGKNVKIIQGDADHIDDFFESDEIDNLFLHFPDPWPKRRQHKNRLIRQGFLQRSFEIQKAGSFFEFKTDSADYFDWALERFKNSPYKVEMLTRDLHNSEFQNLNFQTHFEKLWTSKGLKTHFLRAYKK
jgi:tRNA (guanine-N7-)-methyltransferase